MSIHYKHDMYECSRLNVDIQESPITRDKSVETCEITSKQAYQYGLKNSQVNTKILRASKVIGI